LLRRQSVVVCVKQLVHWRPMRRFDDYTKTEHKTSVTLCNTVYLARSSVHPLIQAKRVQTS